MVFNDILSLFALLGTFLMIAWFVWSLIQSKRREEEIDAELHPQPEPKRFTPKPMNTEDSVEIIERSR